MKRIILASASPRRTMLLKEHGFRFRVIPARIRETMNERDPVRLVKRLARNKARHVARKLRTGLVLGADTVVKVKKRIIGKPKNQTDALRILRTINGRLNRVYTGVALVDARTGWELVDCCETRVYMRRLSETKLTILARKHTDKAGAYAVQERNDAFVKKVQGDYTNVVGLPMTLLLQMIARYYTRRNM
ncbi:MAG: septum formation protein Maf [Elusimicrobia bacterium]|nr:septum formation protein Maf [Elusimicrobiota bacterium]MBD3412536.1 septum formation protein Maf [Elusimicrobiota bacterium]